MAPDVRSSSRSDEVTSKTALLDAAIRLMADRPPSTVTGRELAEEAGVNYGLVHYYFESGAALVQEARRHHVAWLVEDLMDGGSRPVPLGRAMSDPEIFGFAAHVAMEGGFIGDARRPVLDVLDRLAFEADPDGDPVHRRAAVAAIAILQLGWPIFVEHNADGVGLDMEVDGDLIRERFFVALRSLYASIGLEAEE